MFSIPQDQHNDNPSPQADDISDDLVHAWAKALRPIDGETFTQRMVRARWLFADGHRQEQAERIARQQQRIDSIVPRRDANHDLEVELFRLDMQDYARKPSYDTAERLNWSTHNIRFSLGNRRARQLWQETMSQYRLGKLPTLDALQKRWFLDPFASTLYRDSMDD